MGRPGARDGGAAADGGAAGSHAGLASHTPRVVVQPRRADGQLALQLDAARAEGVPRSGGQHGADGRQVGRQPAGRSGARHRLGDDRQAAERGHRRRRLHHHHRSVSVLSVSVSGRMSPCLSRCQV